MPKFKKKIKMAKRIKEAKRLKSLLLIYSDNDDWTPVAMGRIFKANSPFPAELLTVDNAGHAAIMKSKHKAEYEEKIITYFNSQTS